MGAIDGILRWLVIMAARERISAQAPTADECCAPLQNFGGDEFTFEAVSQNKPPKRSICPAVACLSARVFRAGSEARIIRAAVTSLNLHFVQWVSTSDFCHRSALFSYALNSTATDTSQWVSDFNHFVIFDAQSLVACHDFEYIDLMPVRCLQQCESWHHHLPEKWHHLLGKALHRGC